LSVFGIVSLVYLFGAAVIFFDLPSSGFLRKAFLGARAWNERRQVISRNPEEIPVPTVKGGGIDKPGKTFDGYTLCTLVSLSASSTRAFLLDMQGKEVHSWEIPFSKVWPDPSHVPFAAHDRLVCAFGCHLFPNGDLLVVFHGLERPPNSYGLAKLDKDSKVLWKYSATVHHDVDVGEDGTIYAITHEIAQEKPGGLDYVPSECLVDHLVVLSPEGKELARPISILGAFQNSAYTPLLSSPANMPRREPAGLPAGSPADITHMNYVKVMTRRLVPRFPQFKAGQVLVSLRNVDTLAVVDTETRSVVWAARGPWRGQHDAQFLDNGHLLIFDNLGSARSSRVLEYDPQTQAFPWSYPPGNGIPFRSNERGMCQRLPNGNTLIVNSQGREILEVTAGQEVVWSRSFDAFINTGKRYSPDQLPFLKGGPRARP
jgi:hypothetical protein